MIRPDYVQEISRQFAEDPKTYQIDGADRLLDEHARDIRDQTRAFVTTYLSPLAEQIDRENHFPESLRNQIAEAGFWGLSIPEEYGGRGSVLETCVAVEEFSRVSASIGLLISVQLLGSTPMLLGGSAEQRAYWMPKFASGEAFCSFCLTEPTAGTDAASLQTTVSVDADGFVLNGVKHYITGAGRSDVYTVFARSGDGRYEMDALLVDAGSAGFEIDGLHPFTGIRGAPVGRLVFDDVRLPDEARLGEPGRGFQLALATLDRARPGIAAQAVGLAQGALDSAISYLQARQQFGKPLLEQDVIQHRVARHLAAIASGRVLTYHAARLADAEDPALNAVASMAKLYCTDMAMNVVTDAMQFWGGAGYMQGSPIERMYRDVKILQIYEGTNEIQELVIARALMREVSRQNG